MKPIQKIDHAFSRLVTILEAAGSADAVNTQRCICALRLEIARATGDEGRIRAAVESLAELDADASLEGLDGQPEAIELARRLADDEYFISRLAHLPYFTYELCGEAVVLGESARKAIELALGCELEEFQHEEFKAEVGLRVPRPQLAAVQDRMARVISGSVELLPGASIVEIGHVDVNHVVEGYDGPRASAVWTWIEDNASFSHRDNGEASGVWEFVLNLALDFNDVPAELVRVIAQARERDLAYLVFHQDT